jgi:hypothetical protein
MVQTKEIQKEPRDYFMAKLKTKPQASEYRPKSLNKDARIELILKLIERYEQVSAVNDKLGDLFGATADCAALEPFWYLFDDYTRVVSRLIGDDFDWLGWYIYDNQCGKRGMAAKASTWKKNRAIKTAKDLEAIISADYAA